MRKKMKIILVTMVIITAIYVGAVVYANTSSSSSGAIDAASLYHEEPEEWYTPEQLGIDKILGYDENSTWVQVVYGKQGPLVNPDERPVFKYRGKFWQISSLHVTPGLPEEVKRKQVLIGGAICIGWIFTGVLFFKSERKAIFTSSILLIFSFSFLNFPVISATTTTSSDLRAFPALPERVREAEPIFPTNTSTIDYLNTENPYSNQVSPLGEFNESEGNNPIYVLVFGDEEERNSERQDPPYHTWSSYATNQIEFRGDDALASIFGIDVRILGYEEWDSDDSKDSMYTLWDELAAETGSYLGQWYDGEWWQNYVDAVIGITDQETPADSPQIAGLAPGPTEIDKGNIFILLKWQVYWADDNLVQHEVSHLFYADDEYPDCGVMAYHTHYQTFIWEDGLWSVFADVLCAYTSYYWDSHNNFTINTYASSYADEEYTGTLVLRHKPMAFPFTIRGTVSWDYGIYKDIGGSSYTISVESVNPGYQFTYWLVNGVTKVYSETITVYVPADGKVRLAVYFRPSSYYYSPRGGGSANPWLGARLK